MIDLASLAREYRIERPTYDLLRLHLVPAVTECVLAAGIAPAVEARVKEYPSLARKAVKKGWLDAVHRTPDLLGIRLTVPFADLKERIVTALGTRFTVSGDDDKVATYGTTEFRYLGRHMQIGYRTGEEPDARLNGREAELQLHTHAETAWANASHDLTYKTGLALPDSLQRRVNRLLALVELFDNEMAGAQGELVALDGFPAARMLQALERAYLPLALHDFDRELSLVVLNAIVPAYSRPELDTYDRAIDNFVATHRERIERLYARWAADPFAHPLVMQPEAIALFERLEMDPTGLRNAWDGALPPNLLDALAELWGVVLSRPGESD